MNRTQRLALTAALTSAIVGGGAVSATAAPEAFPDREERQVQTVKSAPTADNKIDLKVTPEKNNAAVTVSPYATFRGNEVMVGVNGSRTDLPRDTPLEARMTFQGQTVAVADAGIRSNGTVYLLGGDMKLGTMYERGLDHGSEFTVEIAEFRKPPMASVTATMPQPELSGPWLMSQDGTDLTFEATVHNVPVGIPVRLSAIEWQTDGISEFEYDQVVRSDWRVQFRYTANSVGKPGTSLQVEMSVPRGQSNPTRVTVPLADLK